MRRNVSLVFTLPISVLLATVVLAHRATPQAGPQIVEHAGMCDASAAVPVGPTMFIVGNDEDNVLRVYQRDKPGMPVRTFDLTSYLKPDSKPEADIEGATRVGDRVYWIGSHGANKNGKPRPSRRRLFATDVRVSAGKVSLVPVGTPYSNLVRDLDRSPWLKEYGLGEAAMKAPETMGALNIEGLAATPQGALLIAFRNPIPGGKALLVPLENPKDVLFGKSARLGKPIRVSLGGLGIRSIEYSKGRGKYLIIAGPYGNGGDFRLYEWPGPPSETAKPIDRARFDGLNPEALIVYPEEKARIQILSDDGGRQVGGLDCKDKSIRPENKSFRSVWVTL